MRLDVFKFKQSQKSFDLSCKAALHIVISQTQYLTDLQLLFRLALSAIQGLKESCRIMLNYVGSQSIMQDNEKSCMIMQDKSEPGSSSTIFNRQAIRDYLGSSYKERPPMTVSLHGLDVEASTMALYWGQSCFMHQLKVVSEGQCYAPVSEWRTGCRACTVCHPSSKSFQMLEKEL